MQIQRWCQRALLLAVAAAAGWSSLYTPAAPHAQAGFFSDMYQGIKDITELPSEVNELKESYQQTQDKLEEANATLEAYRQQNEALLEQNRELTESVAALTTAQQIRENQSRKLRIMIITGVLLIAGYFVVLRLIRVLLRR
ncbi:hypothetical protein [Paenibacillus apis]|uniref:Uncharacterized protein n=1 Tax=Paenibacillus apis TaxID=1792174 RepID=A0A920CNR2_9BACL|nr:hypothetical protein [Paenibacillus apis]GIO44094.1 hypothetical protein J41TS4_38520 [Paenibacillus apis]